MFAQRGGPSPRPMPDREALQLGGGHTFAGRCYGRACGCEDGFEPCAHRSGVMLKRFHADGVLAGSAADERMAEFHDAMQITLRRETLRTT